MVLPSRFILATHKSACLDSLYAWGPFGPTFFFFSAIYYMFEYIFFDEIRLETPRG